MSQRIFPMLSECRLLPLLLIFLTGTSALAKGSEGHAPTSWPAMSYQIQTGDRSFSALTERKDFTVSVVEVPAAAEDEFVRELSRKATEPGAKTDSILVAYRGDETFAHELESNARSSAQGKLVPYRVAHDQTALLHEKNMTLATAKRSIAGKYSLQDVQRAGIWVAVAATGVGSSLLYISYGVEPATAGAMVLAFLTTLNVVHQPVMLNYYDAGKRMGEKAMSRVAPQSPVAQNVGGTIGSLNAGFIYHFITSGILKLALNSGNVAAVVGSAELIADLTATAGFSVWSHSTWDIAFNKMRARAPGDETERIIKMFNYANRIFFMALAPVVFSPATHVLGISILAVYGVIGAVAIVKDEAFFRAAERVVEKMEKSVLISRALAAIGSTSRRTKSLAEPLRRQFSGAGRNRSCSAVLMKAI